MTQVTQNAVGAIDVEGKHLQEIKAIVARTLPYKRVLAYGSRVTWQAHEWSDIDMVACGASDRALRSAINAFEESAIPFVVQLLQWESIPQKFKDNIMRQYFVLQKEDDWGIFKLGDVVHTNPIERLSKGTVAKKIEMRILQPHTKRISIYENKEYHGGVKFRNGDTIMASITPCLENGKIAFIDILNNEEIGFGSTEFIVFREKKGTSDSNFIYYLITSPAIKNLAIKSMTGSSGRQRVQKYMIFNCTVKIPLLPEQKAIAEVLSSLDDKIDLLRRQNKTLENIAQTIFRERFIKSADDRWEVKKLYDFGNIICGSTPSKKKKEYFDGDIPFIKIPDMHGKIFIARSTDSLSEAGKQSQEKRTIPPMSIIVSCIATVGLVGINLYESQTNQQINSIVPEKEMYSYFLYCFMKSSTDLLISMAGGGTATLNLNTGNFASIPVKYPGDVCVLDFHKTVKSFFEKIKHNTRQIRTLAQLRDTLLPHLMSGTVRVAH